MVLLYDINTNQTIMEESNIKDNYTILYTATILITKYSCDSYCSSTAAHMQVNKYSTGMYTKEHKVSRLQRAKRGNQEEASLQV